jgi:RimJ/RimL family protein N-acetyltransferase
MELIDVYAETSSSTVLYFLLEERAPEESISHKEMPDWHKHCVFLETRPYLAWYLVMVGDMSVGAVYLSKQREIGIGILKAHQGHGYGAAAVKLLMAMYPGKFLANVAPGNQKSIDLFAKLGFSHIQNTYQL